MKLMITALTLTLIFGSTAARAATWTYPILNDYQAAADQALAAARALSATPAATELAALADGQRDLARIGVSLMNLYADKNPSCAEQFKVFIAETPAMENLTLAEVHKRYHNGEGLPAAPKHCYFGRSQVVHPEMNVIRLKGSWSEKVRSEVLDEIEEVIEHLSRVQKNLDSPPN
jgi:hypothetical protein